MTDALPDHTIRVRYFAMLREQAGRAEESVRTAAPTPQALYRELAARHGLAVDERLLRAAVNDRFADMQTQLNDGDNVVFIPPVSGG